MEIKPEKIKRELERLKEKKKAIILAHSYQPPEVQEVADFIGDSLQLAMKSMETDADVIVFAGVSFMAEMAAILNPDKKVIHPDPCAGCPLASYLPACKLREIKKEHPGIPVVLYVNSFAEAKAEADYIVTSSSASKLISRVGEEEFLFGPDRNLASFVSEVVGKKIVPIPGKGHCYVHEYEISKEIILRAKKEHPRAKVFVHPEVSPEARRIADFVGSTAQMLKAISEIEADEYVLGTEEGLTYRARKIYPEKRIFPANPEAICNDMKRITLRKLYESLESEKKVVKVSPDIERKVREILERSLEIIRRGRCEISIRPLLGVAGGGLPFLGRYY